MDMNIVCLDLEGVLVPEIWIDISMGGAFPSLMDAAIARRKDELRGVKVRGYLIFQPIQMVENDPTREHFIYNSWHLSGYERKLCDRGLCNFIPMVFRNLGWYYTQFLTVNVAISASSLSSISFIPQNIFLLQKYNFYMKSANKLSDFLQMKIYLS